MIVRFTNDVTVLDGSVKYSTKIPSQDMTAIILLNIQTINSISMNKLEVIGNLGADAEVKVENGKKFVSLSIADTRRRKKADGTTEEKTMWVSATINGDGGELMKYLVKGVKVWATGDMEVRTYHSEKQRCLVAGVKMFVRDIQLISTNVDDVPRDLYDEDGVAHRVTKHFYCDTAKDVQLYNRAGENFTVDKKGWVAKVVEQNAINPDGEQVNNNEK